MIKTTLLDRVEPVEYIGLPACWIPNKDVAILEVSSCKHFKRLGIREGSFIGIDTTKEFKKGEPCAFLKYDKNEPRFRLSRTLLNGYECIGRLCLVVSFPTKEVK